MKFVKKGSISAHYDDLITTKRVSFYRKINPNQMPDYTQGKQAMLNFIENDIPYVDEYTLNEKTLRDIFENDIASIVGLDGEYDIRKIAMGILRWEPLTPDESRYLGAYEVINEVLNGELSWKISNIDTIDKDLVSGHIDKLTADIEKYNEMEANSTMDTEALKSQISHSKCYSMGCLKGYQEFRDGTFNLPNSERIDRDFISDTITKCLMNRDQYNGETSEFKAGYLTTIRNINTVLQKEDCPDLKTALDKLSTQENTQEL